MTEQDATAPEILAAWDQARAEGIAAAKAAIAAGQPGTYTAQPGDTFESIAWAIYGDAGADALHRANAAAGAVGSDATILPPGTVLTVPAFAGGADVADESAPGQDAPATEPTAPTADQGTDPAAGATGQDAAGGFAGISGAGAVPSPAPDPTTPGA